MSKTRIALWGVPLTAWLLFSAWYTDLGGPLTEDEVAEAMSVLNERGTLSQQKELLNDFLKNDTGRQFFMVNIIDMNDAPPRMESFGPDATAKDFMNHYMEHMYPELLRRACHPIFVAAAVGPTLDVVGIEGAGQWESAALMRYRSRRSFLEIVLNPEIGPRHEYKMAALTKTIAYPVEPGLYLSDPRLLLVLVLGLSAAMLDILVSSRSR